VYPQYQINRRQIFDATDSYLQKKKKRGEKNEYKTNTIIFSQTSFDSHSCT
jgi:hypothetical protein